jgi:hypothetical protein
VLLLHPALDRELANTNLPLHRSTYQKLGVSIRQSASEVDFALWVRFFSSMGQIVRQSDRVLEALSGVCWLLRLELLAGALRDHVMLANGGRWLSAVDCRPLSLRFHETPRV